MSNEQSVKSESNFDIFKSHTRARRSGFGKRVWVKNDCWLARSRARSSLAASFTPTSFTNNPGAGSRGLGIEHCTLGIFTLTRALAARVVLNVLFVLATLFTVV